MREEELTEIYTEIARTLEALELGWVVDQVSEQVRLGRTESTKIRTLQESLDREASQRLLPSSPRAMRSGPKAIFTAAVDYSPRDSLILLLDAVEQAVVVTAEMEHEIIQFFPKGEEGSSPKIAFESEEVDQRRFVLTAESTASRRDYAQALKRLLEELRREVLHAD
jgi:hypothetical protein